MRFIQGLIVAFVSMCVTAPCALAQWAHPVERQGHTLIRREHIDRFVEHFHLDDDRATIARGLYDELLTATAAFNREAITPAKEKWDAIIRPLIEKREQYREEWVEASKPERMREGSNFREAFEKLKDVSDQISELSPQNEIELAKLADQQAAMDAAFLENLHTLLTLTERERWPTYRRWLDRQRFLGAFRYHPTVAVDLLHHLESIELTEDDLADRTTFDAVCLEYELAIDRHLTDLVEWQIDWSRKRSRRQIERNRAGLSVPVRDENGQVVGVVQADPETYDRLVRFENKQHKFHIELRDVNRSYHTQIIGQLSPDAARAFRESVEEALIGRLWDRERSKSFAFVRLLDEKAVITDAQREVMGVWLDELDRFRTETAHAYLEAEDAMLDLRAEPDPDFDKDRELSDEMRRHERLGYERDNEVIERLWTQLTPEQQAQVERPKPWSLR